jgi:hypothetical protein
VHEVLYDLLQRQRRAGFPDLAGAEAIATVPIADRLVNEIIARTLPPAGRLRELLVRADDGNQLRVTLRLSAGGLNLPVSLTLVIDEQPELPHNPALGLRLSGAPALFSLAAPVMRSLDLLPPGITLDGDRIRVDLQIVLAHYGKGELLNYVRELRVSTAARVIVLTIRAQTPR